jgi:hypothetical protein
MPSKHSAGAKKKSVKALAQKEVVAKEAAAKSSAKKAGKRAIRGKENDALVLTLPAAEAHQDPNSEEHDAELTFLRGKYFSFLLHAACVAY